MNPNMAYYALETKVISKKGHILKKADWHKFIESSSVEQLTNLFRNNEEISKAFKDVQSDNLSREELETVLFRFKTLEIENLLHYFSGPYKEFIKTVLMEAEIQDLNLIIRKITKGESLEGIEERFVHSEIYSNLPFNDLITCTSVEQLNQKLKGTTYYNVLSNFHREDVKSREFHIEMKMYMALYKSLLEKAEKLKKDDEKAAKEVLGMRIDSLNIQWIFRAHYYYNLSPQEIFIYSLSGGKVLGYNRMKKLCYASIEEFKKLLNDYMKHDIYKNLNVADINVVIDSYMLDYLKKSSFNNIGTVLSFIYMLGIIINDLTSITEGIQYKVPKENLMEYLAYKI